MGVPVACKGCFWYVQYAFSCLVGVTRTAAGYMGGQGEYPLYDETEDRYYAAPAEGHSETVLVEYNASLVRGWCLNGRGVLWV